jgi:hypothetical protein
MTERKLKLIKTEKSQPEPLARAGEAEQPAPRLVPHPIQLVEPEAEPETEAETEYPTLTQAEAAEAARFRALIAARAARQAMLHRLIAELEELDEISPAA